MNKAILVSFFLIFTNSLFSQESKLPNVELTSLNGKTISITDALNEEGVTVFSLWATWCVPCLKELDAINDVYEDWQDETNVKLVAVSIDDSRTVKRVKPLINGKNWDYQVLLDTNNDLKRAVNAVNVPYLFIVKDNVIVYEHTGYNPGGENELFEKIKELSN